MIKATKAQLLKYVIKAMVAINMSHWKLLGKRLVYELKVILGYQRILGPKNAQTHGGKRNQKK
jgi:hypothetical protein